MIVGKGRGHTDLPGRVEVVLRLLTDGPDDVELVVGDGGVGEGVGAELLPEEDRRLAVALEAHGRREVVGAAVERVVPTRGGPLKGE